jgi:hypothetical protein
VATEVTTSEEEFKQQFEEWLQRAWEWYQRKQAEGYTEKQILEIFWGKDLLERWKKL